MGKLATIPDCETCQEQKPCPRHNPEMFHGRDARRIPFTHTRYSNELRALWYARADYYAWAARRPFVPVGRDPITGQDWDALYGVGRPGSIMARKMARAAATAMARTAYENARAFDNPLPEDRNAARLAWENAPFVD